MKTLILLILLVVVAACSAQPINHSVPSQRAKQEAAEAARERFERQWARRAAMENGVTKREAHAREEKAKKIGGRKYANLILKGKAVIGMNREQVEAARGNPRDINRTVGSWGVHEQWVYGDSYLYFENGVMTSYQD